MADRRPEVTQAGSVPTRLKQGLHVFAEGVRDVGEQGCSDEEEPVLPGVSATDLASNLRRRCSTAGYSSLFETAVALSLGLHGNRDCWRSTSWDLRRGDR
jgi:hypothetical protein